MAYIINVRDVNDDPHDPPRFSGAADSFAAAYIDSHGHLIASADIDLREVAPIVADALEPLLPAMAAALEPLLPRLMDLAKPAIIEAIAGNIKLPFGMGRKAQ